MRRILFSAALIALAGHSAMAQPAKQTKPARSCFWTSQVSNFSAIDERTVAELLTLVDRWRTEGRTVIVVLHDFDLVRRVFPETLLLARETVAWGKTADVLSAQNLLSARRMVEAFDREAHECERAA